jgi:ribosomal protein S18 acetylase RimI-like enzyme
MAGAAMFMAEFVKTSIGLLLRRGNRKMSSLKISLADPASYRVALPMAFADLAPQEREMRIESALQQLRIPGLFTAIQEGTILGAVYSLLRSDKTLLLWPPGTLNKIEDVTGRDTEIRSALYRRIDLLAEEMEAGPIIAFVEDRPREELESAGFEYVSDILTLIADEFTFPMEGASDRLSFLVRPEETVFEEMLPLFERTFEKTNDFPKLAAIAPAAEVLRSYQTDTGYRPDLWFFVQAEQEKACENVGCLILMDHPEFEQLELTYLGLLPEHRGRKYASPIVQHAQRIARKLGRRMVTVSVDSQNQAALRVYGRCGFQFWSKKSLYLKINDK